MGVTGAPGDVPRPAGRARAAGADTVYFHLYDVADLDHVRLLGREVLPQLDLIFQPNGRLPALRPRDPGVGPPATGLAAGRRVRPRGHHRQQPGREAEGGRGAGVQDQQRAAGAPRRTS